jgi:5-methylcytosine-specific restriction endonuclease McrA
MPLPLNPNNYHGWRTLVLRRDGYRCVLCGSTNRPEADHIKSFVRYPGLRYSVENGRTLCHSCHKESDTYGGGSRRTRAELIKQGCA